MLLYGQMGGDGSKRSLSAYTEGLGQKVNVGGAGSATWPDGTWHLLVLNWRPDVVELSVDEQSPSRAVMKQPVNFEGGANKIIVSQNHDANGDGFLIDELMVLDTPLEAADIDWMYAHGPPGKLAASD